jgi:perosamine synthetase
LTNNEAIARYAKHLTTTAKLPHRWEYRHDEIGFNYRLPNINAALGCAQLEQLPSMIGAKRELFSRYQAAFANIKGLKLVKEPPNSYSNYWLQTLLLDNDHAGLRDSVLTATNDASLMTRPAWILMHELDSYKNCPRMDLSSAESLSRRLINIPSSSCLVSPR